MLLSVWDWLLLGTGNVLVAVVEWIQGMGRVRKEGGRQRDVIDPDWVVVDRWSRLASMMPLVS